MARITKAERRERLELTLKLIAERRTKAEVKRGLREQFGVGARTAERYLARAREELLDQTGLSRDEHRCEALAFYRTVCGDSSASVRDRLFAAARIDKLLGLELVDAPEPTGSAAHALDVEKARAAIVAAINLGIAGVGGVAGEVGHHRNGQAAASDVA